MKSIYELDEVNQIATVDCQYIKPLLASAYIVVDGDEVAIIETNTSRSVPIILTALQELDKSVEQVKYIIVTHVHLDHAGGAGSLMQLCQNATLLAHPRAGRHLIDPSRLVNSSIEVYGEESFRKLYGEILPVVANRVRTLNDGEEVKLGNRTFKFLHTRGHANHHFCIYDSKSNGVFTGDSFGIAYPILQTGGPYIYPTSTPTDFDPDEARKSITKIRETGCSKLYLTHFGKFTTVDEAERQMRQGLDFLEDQLNNSILKLKAGNSIDSIQQEVATFILERMMNEMKNRGVSLDNEANQMMGFDAELNAQGIVFTASRRAR
ncbi:MAG: MBL fold metallo-hydrolase [Leptonema sp. (in: Bacteria)]|nr:MBL fold metallo-hydrolase [Leptonema sp. (in: bacteria)]